MTANKTTPIDAMLACIDELHLLRNALTCELTALTSLTTALRLAANADEGGGARALYWPDLIGAVEVAIPRPEKIDAAVDVLLGHMRTVVEAVGGRATGAACFFSTPSQARQ